MEHKKEKGKETEKFHENKTGSSKSLTDKLKHKKEEEKATSAVKRVKMNLKSRVQSKGMRLANALLVEHLKEKMQEENLSYILSQATNAKPQSFNKPLAESRLDTGMLPKNSTRAPDTMSLKQMPKGTTITPMPPGAVPTILDVGSKYGGWVSEEKGKFKLNAFPLASHNIREIESVEVPVRNSSELEGASVKINDVTGIVSLINKHGKEISHIKIKQEK